MAIAFANLGSSANPDLNSNTDDTSYSNSSWTPPASGLILVFVHARGSSAGAAVAPSVSGNSLTWTQIASDIRGSDRLTLFAANASGSSTGATTFDFGSNGQLNCTAAFMQATGVDLSGGVAACFVQAVTNNSNTITGTITLSAAADAAHRAASGWWRGANESVTPRTNWDEYDELAGTGPVRVVETQARSDAFETTASATFDSAGAWVGIAVELKIAASGIAGTASVTLAAATASATGQLLIAGTASLVSADATLIAAGTVALRAALNATPAAATMLSTGRLLIAGTAGVVLGDATVAAVGAVAVRGTASVTLDNTTLSATGVVVSGRVGALSVTLDNAVTLAAARLAIASALAVPLGNAVLAATGMLAEGAGGSLAVSLADAMLAAAGATAIVGTASIVLDNGQLTAAGATAITGVTVVYLADATLTAVGVEIVIRQIVLGAVCGTRRRGGVASTSRRGTTAGVGGTGTIWG